MKKKLILSFEDLFDTYNLKHEHFDGFLKVIQHAINHHSYVEVNSFWSAMNQLLGKSRNAVERELEMKILQTETERIKYLKLQEEVTNLLPE